jgi:hypothetical protein
MLHGLRFGIVSPHVHHCDEQLRLTAPLPDAYLTRRRRTDRRTEPEPTVRQTTPDDEALLRQVRALGVVVRVHPPGDHDDAVVVTSWNAPTLHVLRDGAEPPWCDLLADWVRAPLDPVEVRARADAVLAQSRTHPAPAVTLDADGVLRVGATTVVLSPSEHRLLSALLEVPGSMVPFAALTTRRLSGRELEANGEAEAEDGPEAAVARKRTLARLRAKLRGTRLAVRTVRGRGLLVELVPPDELSHPPAR